MNHNANICYVTPRESRLTTLKWYYTGPRLEFQLTGKYLLNILGWYQNR